MQIHGGSELGSNNVFLHAGYASAYDANGNLLPEFSNSPFGIPFGGDYAEPVFSSTPTPQIKTQGLSPMNSLKDYQVQQPVTVNLALAFQLKENQTEVTAQSGITHPTGVAHPLPVQIPLLILLIVVFVCSLTVFYLHRAGLSQQKHFSRLNKWIFTGALSVILGFATFFVAADFSNQTLTKTPDELAKWEASDFDTREYLNPGKATLALMHGVIGDVLSNAPHQIHHLREIQNDISLPIENLSDGQQYALDSYGLDGWGTPFRLDKLTTDTPSYNLTTAGPDREFNTRDDLTVAIRNNFFIQETENHPLSLYCHHKDGQYVLHQPLWDEAQENSPGKLELNSEHLKQTLHGIDLPENQNSYANYALVHYSERAKQVDFPLVLYSWHKQSR